MAEPALETGRLVLRLPEPGDLGWQQRWLNTKTVMRHLGGVRLPEEMEPAFSANAAAMAAGEPGFWTVVLKDGGEPIGKCGLAPITVEDGPTVLRGAVQVGWSLAEPFWGRGYAAEAARAAIGHAFAGRGLDTLWAQTSDSNAASTALMHRLGFERCKQYDYVDPAYPPADNPTTIYRMTRPQWQSQA